MITKYTASDANDIGFAITRSHTYNELVTVALADGVTMEQALVWVSQRSESHCRCRFDSSDTGARREDVWGDDGQGGEFRLHLVEASA